MQWNRWIQEHGKNVSLQTARQHNFRLSFSYLFWRQNCGGRLSTYSNNNKVGVFFCIWNFIISASARLSVIETWVRCLHCRDWKLCRCINYSEYSLGCSCYFFRATRDLPNHLSMKQTTDNATRRKQKFCFIENWESFSANNAEDMRYERTKAKYHLLYNKFNVNTVWHHDTTGRMDRRENFVFQLVTSFEFMWFSFKKKIYN